MPQQLPAVSLVAVPGRRRATLEVAREIERRGFAGIYAPSVFSNMSLCEALAHVTERIAFGTSIAPIYARTVGDFAQSAAFLHEVQRRIARAAGDDGQTGARRLVNDHAPMIEPRRQDQGARLGHQLRALVGRGERPRAEQR